MLRAGEAETISPMGETKVKTNSLLSTWWVSIGARGQEQGRENGRPKREKGQTSQRSCCPSRDWEERGEGGVRKELESDMCSPECCGQWEKPSMGGEGRPQPWLPALGSIFCASTMAVGMLPSPLRASFLPPCPDHFAVPKVPLIPDPTSCPSLAPPRVLMQEEARAKRTDPLHLTWL